VLYLFTRGICLTPHACRSTGFHGMLIVFVACPLVLCYGLIMLHRLLGMPHETAIAMASMIFGGVFERHPSLRICFAHGGGCFPGLIGRLSHGFQARPDLCQTMCKKDPREFLRNVYVDSLVHDSDILQLVAKKFGTDRIILGSDYPFPLGEIDYPGRVIDETYCSECTDGSSSPDQLQKALDRENMLWRNAERFLKLNLDDVINSKRVSAVTANNDQL
jgi:aminocarboxymuconate-semialdehyde decarboxylase